MAKVSKKSEKLTPFGGIYFTNRAFNALSLKKPDTSALQRATALRVYVLHFRDVL